MKVALVHYWLTSLRGGEKVAQEIARLFPDLEVFTHVSREEVTKECFPGRRVHHTFIAKMPASAKIYPIYLPLMPIALESLDLSSFDLVISSESGPAKWVIAPPGTPHICYCHSPLRYAWDQSHIYRNQVPVPLRFAFDLTMHSMRNQDFISAQRVDRFVANSNFVRSRIAKYYRRDSEVIHPPVDVGRFSIGVAEDFYLSAGALVGYKRVELAVLACNHLGRRLIVVGDGPELARLKAIASKNVTFLGRVSDGDMRDLMGKCRALLFPGVEDFGITPVEVLASGRPVIAQNAGGILDTVQHGVNGVLYDGDTVRALSDAISEFERMEHFFDPVIVKKSAEKFGISNFIKKFSGLVNETLQDR